jgi:endonuclease I
MKRFSLVALLLISGLLKAQFLMVADTIDFGVVLDDAPASQNLELINTGQFSIEIVDIDLFKVYGDEPFIVGDTSGILFPGDTFTTILEFQPEHNIYHNLALVVKTNSGFGHELIQLTGQGRYSNSYYLTTENLSEEALKTALKNKLASGYTQLSYSVARDNMYATIDNTNGDVECVYTGRTATFNTRAGANTNSFNTEHTFPQGFFNQNLPMRSDIHHLYPTDVTSNSQRGNDPFGVVSGSPSWQNGGSKKGGGVFEPRDIHKGTCARAMMYFVIRYQDYSNHFSGQETTLRQWHNLYPPSMDDRARNVAIETVQSNRNPFIDYPQFEERISRFVATSIAPSVSELYYSDDTIQVLGNTSGRFDYNFVLYNSGNEDVDLDNFNLTDTSLYFPSGFPSSISLEGGESYTLSISYNSAINYAAELSFDTDITGLNTINVPIRSGATIGLDEGDKQISLEVYPNPVEGILQLGLKSSLIEEVSIYTLTGIHYQMPNRNKLDISALPSGMYIVAVKTYDGGFASSKIIKK